MTPLPAALPRGRSGAPALRRALILAGCLAAHRDAIPDRVGFRSCVKGVHGADGAIECMRRLAR